MALCTYMKGCVSFGLWSLCVILACVSIGTHCVVAGAVVSSCVRAGGSFVSQQLPHVEIYAHLARTSVSLLCGPVCKCSFAVHVCVCVYENQTHNPVMKDGMIDHNISCPEAGCVRV